MLAETGIDDRRLYDGSRHTAGTILNELGVDMPTIMETLRHTQISREPTPAPETARETRPETEYRPTVRSRRRRRIH